MAEAPVYPLRQLRNEGLEAYTTFYEAIGPGGDAAGRVEAATALPPHPDMPLRVLLWLGVDARSGALERFYAEPASERFRSWFDRAYIPELFPDVGHRAARLPWLTWNPPPDDVPWHGGRISWRVLHEGAREIAAAVEVTAAGGEIGLFALVRDWMFDLDGLLESVGHDAERLVTESRDFLLPPPPVRPSRTVPESIPAADDLIAVERIEAEIAAELGLPTSSWTVLAAFLRSHEGPPFPPYDAVLNAIRRLARASVSRRPARTISRDFWVDTDTLGHGVYADAVTEFIRHPETRPPLTIGIKAPWGAGKTSLMRMVRKALDPEPDEPLPALDRGTPPPSVRDVLASVRRPVASRERTLAHEREPKPATAEPKTAADRRPTVWFNAWKYQSAEQIWAGLGHEIIRQLTARMGHAEGERFWLRLNVTRVDEQRIRRVIYRALFDRLLSRPAVVVFAVCAALAAVIALALPPSLGDWKAGGAIAFGGSVVSLAATAYRTVSRFLSSDVSVTASELVQEPDYEGQLGFLHLVHSDMERVLRLVATEEQPVVVFIDDLDRCSWTVVTKVVEAINLFLAGDFPNCVFVIAMEPDVVAAHIQVAYGDLIKALDETAEAPPLGWRFLEKMVQLPLSLPAPEPNQLDAYVDAILGRPRDGFRPSAEHLDALEHALRAEQPDWDELPNAALRKTEELTGEQQPQLPTEFARVVLRAVGERFTDEDEQVRTLVKRHAKDFSDNPRQIKRFINVFRFYAFIQVARRVNGLTAPTFEQIAKLSVLAVRWPNLLGAFGRPYDASSPERVLARLETAARAGEKTKKWQEAVEAARLPARVASQLGSTDLRRLLAEEPRLGTAASGFL